MDERYLIDTNILIYCMAHELPDDFRRRMIDILSHSFSISIITEIEFLGWRGHTKEGYSKAAAFLADTEVHGIDREVRDAAIQLRRAGSIKLPDAVIAATALVHDRTLVTRNISDFSEIALLKVLNPFA